MSRDKERRALGDLTNLPGKRGFSFILGDVGAKSRETLDKYSDVGDEDSPFGKHVCLGVDNLLRGKSVGKNSECGIENSVASSMETEAFSMNTASGLNTEAKIPNSSKEDQNRRVDTTIGDGFRVEDASRKSYVHLEIQNLVQNMFTAKIPEVRMPNLSNKGTDKGIQIHDVIQLDDSSGESSECNKGKDSIFQIRRQSEKELGGFGKLASNKSGSVEWLKLPNPQGSKNIDMERSKFLKVSYSADKTHESSDLSLERCKLLRVSDNQPESHDPLKGCSCSFCFKAAYIWSDLHYQDIKGRIAALSKSQKEATALIQRTGKAKDLMPNASGSSSEPSKLESDLMNQWRSLFLHMEGVLVSESNRLQPDFMALKDMRESCKMDLEAIKKRPEDRD